MIEPGHTEIPIYRQCDLLELSRAGYYYQPQGESLLNLHLMNVIDEQYTRMPYYGVAKMTAWLIRQSYEVNSKRVRRLMRLMGLEAIYPKRNLSISSPEHKKYPYLLRDVLVERPDQVWSTDITYIKMAQGFVYLVAVMDWYSRYVLPGDYPIRWTHSFALTPWRGRWRSHNLIYSTLIRDHSLRAQSLRDAFYSLRSRSVWTVGVGRLITSLWSACGAR